MLFPPKEHGGRSYSKKYLDLKRFKSTLNVLYLILLIIVSVITWKLGSTTHPKVIFPVISIFTTFLSYLVFVRKVNINEINKKITIANIAAIVYCYLMFIPANFLFVVNVKTAYTIGLFWLVLTLISINLAFYVNQMD